MNETLSEELLKAAKEAVKKFLTREYDKKIEELKFLRDTQVAAMSVEIARRFSVDMIGHTITIAFKQEK